jgi:hypothetical protein
MVFSGTTQGWVCPLLFPMFAHKDGIGIIKGGRQLIKKFKKGPIEQFSQSIASVRLCSFFASHNIMCSNANPKS